MQKTLLLFVLLLTLLANAEDGSSVIVIYNSAVPDSKTVADYYASKRHVPQSQIFGFRLSTDENMSRIEFRQMLQRPLQQELEKQKLFVYENAFVSDTNGVPHMERRVKESKIRYAVLCYGVPLRITHDASIHEDHADKLPPELRKNNAAVEADLAMLPKERFLTIGPLANPFYAETNSSRMNPTNGILLVTRLDGPTVALAKGLVDKAIQAETDGLWGRGYFDIRGLATNDDYWLGDDWIRNAYDVVNHFGYEVTLDEHPETFPPWFPMSQTAFYAGWYDANPSGPFTRSFVEFMPGAIAYHLHSSSAASIRTSNANWVGPLIAAGATATMGCVDEPYLRGTPDIGTFFSRLTFFGMSFGEAAYAGQVSLSWQTAVIGDPLYRPFGKKPQVLHEELERRKSPLIEWSHLRVVDLNLVKGYPMADVVKYLQDLEITKQSAVLQEKLGDMYDAQGKSDSAIHSYSEALRLHPTRLQEVRLTLVLGGKLTGAGQDQKAFDLYYEFLRKFPEYPDPVSVYQKLLPIATKLEKKTDEEFFQKEIQRLSNPSVNSGRGSK